MRPCPFRLIGKGDKHKGGKGDVVQRKEGEMEIEGKKPVRLKREETDVGPLVCLGSGNSEATLSE